MSSVVNLIIFCGLFVAAQFASTAMVFQNIPEALLGRCSMSSLILATQPGVTKHLDNKWDWPTCGLGECRRICTSASFGCSSSLLAALALWLVSLLAQSGSDWRCPILLFSPVDNSSQHSDPSTPAYLEGVRTGRHASPWVCPTDLIVSTKDENLEVLKRQIQGGFFDWFRPKSSKCWRWQNP